MSNAFGIEHDSNVWREKIQSLFDSLTEKRIPEGVVCDLPVISRLHANRLIWLMQEVLEMIPRVDIEPDLCSECEELYYNCEEGGHCEKCGQSKCDACGGRRCAECHCCSDCCECEAEADK